MAPALAQSADSPGPADARRGSGSDPAPSLATFHSPSNASGNLRSSRP